MKTPKEMYEEHLNRIKTAISLGKPDRPPIMFNAIVFCAKYMGMDFSEFITDVERANNNVLIATLLLGNGEIDAIPSKGVYPPERETFTQMKLPGRDLPKDALWQVVEKEVMTEKDYDTIIDKGFSCFKEEYSKRFGNMREQMKTIVPLLNKNARNLNDAGIVVFSKIFSESIFGFFSSARSMPKFFRDLHRIPDKVQAAMDVAITEVTENLRKQIRQEETDTVFVGGSGASFVSAKLFERFELPYQKRIIETIVDEGKLVHLHFDSNWDMKLEYFREFPKGKCALALDGSTNIFKAKEILGDHMCIMGDVPPSLLSLGTPDEVYNYCTKLVNEIGPAGYIMSAGCGAPPDSSVDNIKAMISAATGK